MNAKHRLTTRRIATPGFAVLSLLFAAAPTLAQTSELSPDSWCGTKLTPEAVEALSSAHAADRDDILESDRQAGGFYRAVRTKVHIVRRTNGTGGISPSAIQSAVDRANEELQGAGIMLLLYGEIDYIDADLFYDVRGDSMIYELFTLNQDSNAMDVYFVNTVWNNNGPLCGAASFSSQPDNGIVMAIGCTNAGPTFSHEVGHYFDLYHTYETAAGVECVNRDIAGPGACATSGDLLCDTPAERIPPSGNPSEAVNAQCQFIGTWTDWCLDTPYESSPWNTMGFVPPVCCRGFTAGQAARARNTLLNLRAGHALVDLFINRQFHVRPGATGSGQWSAPLGTVQQALTAIGTLGGLVAFHQDNANEGPLLLDKPVVLVNVGASAVWLGN